MTARSLQCMWSRRLIMRKFIITSVLGLGIAAFLPASCIPGIGASNTPAPTVVVHV